MTTVQRHLRRRVRLQLEQLEDRTVPTLLGHQLYPSDHPWNQRIANAPVAANSDAIIGNILQHYGNERIHPDFGQDFHDGSDLYGIPYNVVHGNSTPLVDVVIDGYPSESDLVPAPIPPDAVLENDYQNGPRFGVENRSDSHLIVFDVDNNIAYEFFRASRPNENADGKWHADQQTVWNMNTNAFRTIGYTSADAAGLSVLAGLVRPDEALPVDQGGQGVINHAIRVTLEGDLILNQFQYPASHRANPGSNNPSVQIPMGGRLRLRADVDIAHLNPQSRIIAQAMKDYGLIVADNGSNFFFQGASSSMSADNEPTLTWDDNDIQDWDRGLFALTFSDFQVIDLTPRVTGLDVHEGEAGTVVTITGQNFAGAAGQLHVWFGSTEATSVTFIDDAHVQAVAPAGSGSVDVRVQSGVPFDSAANYTSPIFGYGVSAVNAETQFSYPAPQNSAPTIAQAAMASPAYVTAYTTTLNVLGADDGGEGNLVYSWSTVSKPAGVPDADFQSNGSNSAKNTAAVFYRTGTYTLRVSATDAQGLTAISDVTVIVAPTLSFVIVVPATKKVLIYGNVKFFAYALDQYGYLMPQQPKFAWRLIGQGYLAPAGRYFAPATPGGPYTVVARAGAIRGTAKVNVVRTLVKPTTLRAALLPGN